MPVPPETLPPSSSPQAPLPGDLASALVRSSVDGLLAFDLGCRYTLWNPAMERFTGKLAAEVLGQRAFDVFPHLLELGVNRLFQRALTGDTTVVENYVVVLGGRRRFFDRHYAPLRDGAGVVIGGVGVVRDVTARREAEEALREREEQFRSVVENATDAIGIVNGEGHALYVNPALERMFGYDRELVGHTVLGMAHPDDLARAAEGLMRVITEVGTSSELEARWRQKDGGWRTLDGHSRSFLDREGGVRVVLQARDVTASKQAREDLERTREALMESQERLRASQKMEAIGRLAGGVAHDFNNLLTVIMSCSDLIARAHAQGIAPQTQAVQGYIEEIAGAAERGAALTRQLLTFSRKQPVQSRVFDLNAIVVEAQTLLKRLIGEHIAVETKLDPRARYVRADPGQIEQVIVNLVLNARDAIGQRGGHILVATQGTSAAPPDGAAFVALRVEDDGAGMTDDVKAHLFEPFFTTKPRGQGTGLGLASVYGIVQQSGGRVSVRSAVGKGTTIEVLLVSGEEALEARRASVHASARPEGDETILLVEDEAPLRRLIREVLADSGYRVVEAADGDEAMRVVAQRVDSDSPIDLVLSDVVMPGMSGHQLASGVRQKWPQSRVLLMSGYDEAAGREGAEPILGKPFTASALTQRVRQVLDAAPGAVGAQ